MNPILISTMALFGVVGGYIGWRRATRPINRRMHFEVDPPAGMSRRDHERAYRRRLRRWRLVATFFYAVGSALLGVLFLILLARR